jgi:hypothetical protein
LAQKDRANIVAAIMGGIAAFMEEEQRASVESAPEQRPAPVVNLWSLWGREETMRMRSMWQRRMVCR